ncbi:MAG: VCBS repeat-containing protein [Bacteroidota bacterium]
MKARSLFSGILFLLIATLQFSCKHSGQKDAAPIFQLMENTGIDFTNTVTDTKDFNIFTFRNFYNGGGAAIGDINNDGLADVFFTANMGTNKLYLNKGDFKFDDISEKAGFKNKDQWSTGVVMVDINNDGWLDIFVSNSGHINDGVSRENQLFINNHDLTFTESAKAYGLADNGYTTQVAFFDYDMDGDLDCFIVNNSPIPVNTLNYANQRDLPAENWPIKDFLKGGGDHLLRNDNGKFVEVTHTSGIHGSLISFGLGVTIGDVNGDHYPDIYVSNDFFERDYLYINQKDGTFKDELENWVQHTSLASMGADMGDINNDGYPDIFTTDMLADDDYRLKTTSSFDNIDVYRLKEKSGFYHQFQQNTLQVNNKHGKFLDAAYYGGVAASDWSWGGLLFDADNDGLTDLYICNGINNDLTNQDFIDFFANDIVQKMVMTGKKDEVNAVISKMPRQALLNKAFRNEGNLKFSDNGKAWGFTQPSFSNGAAYGDLDNDGDLDMVINNENSKAFIYKNNSREINKNNYIGFILKGKGKNSFAIGSQIKLFIGDQILSREVQPTRGFQSSVDYKVIIGLGKETKIDSFQIIWPDRTYSVEKNPTINLVHQVKEPEHAPTIPDAKKAIVVPILTEVKSSFEKHNEDDLIDFYNERNIPRILSKEGPKAAVGDVNGDGLEDIYIAGTPKHAGQLYLQKKSGGFEKKPNPAFERFSDFEDVAVLFFDCDGDGDLDLFVGAGGNNTQLGSRIFQHRLYKNDGKGNFDIDVAAFGNNEMNIAVVTAYDFDHDGDLDLFVGARSYPGNYGVTPTSYLYVNDGKGHFTDMAKTKNPDIANVGMVTGAVWADIIGDSNKELVLVGEWMNPKVFAFNKDHFEEVKTNLTDMKGWWQSVAVADLNGDGKEDLVLGNLGENFYLHPDKENPVKIWVADFDQNNIVDKILTRTVNGKDLPVFLKRDLEEQLPILKKQNLRHEVFAKKSVQELFSSDLINKAIVKEFNYSSSCIAMNKGGGQFEVKKLSPYIQLSCINAIKCMDINGDGFTDLVIGGNNFGFPPMMGRLDASLGNILLNDGKGNFTAQDANVSGIELRGEIRDIQKIKSVGKDYLLVLQNDTFPVLYNIRKGSMKK